MKYLFTLALTLNNAGGAWDNAKKFIEAGNEAVSYTHLTLPTKA